MGKLKQHNDRVSVVMLLGFTEYFRLSSSRHNSLWHADSRFGFIAMLIYGVRSRCKSKVWVGPGQLT